jgi:HSP20 family protein
MAENRLTEYNQPGQSLSLRGAMDRLLEDAFVPSLATTDGRRWPAMDIRDTPEAFVVEAAVPGIKPDEVEITVQNQTLTIRGEVKEEAETQRGEYLYRERSFGRFSRQVQFPSRVDADKAEASFDNGILRLTVPKAEETKPRRIEVKPRTTAG